MWNIKCEHLLIAKISQEKEFYYCEKRSMLLTSSRQCIACQQCERCAMKDEVDCGQCADNFIYAAVPRQSFFQYYKPVCPRGYIDCVWDPGYIHFHYPDWYKKLYGDLAPKEAIKQEGGCLDKMNKDPDEKYYCYDDEDK